MDKESVKFYKERFQPKSPVNGTSLPVTFAKCCHPIPGDSITGIISPANELMIHRRECRVIQNLLNLKQTNLIELDWDSLHERNSYSEIKITATNRPDLMNDITSTILSCEDVIIRGISFDTHDTIFEGNINLSIPDTKHLNDLFKKLYDIQGIKLVERVLA